MPSIKDSIINLFPETILRKYRSYRYQTQRATIFDTWSKQGNPLPPPHVIKQLTIEECQGRSTYKVLVETGTFLGDMVEAQRNNFDKIYSIELSARFYENAKKRFKKYGHIEIVHGDSGKMMKEVLEKIHTAAIFWLDGHYSGDNTALGEKECPIYEELNSILSTQHKHAILIDDARLFVGTHDYPTIDDLNRYINGKRPDYDFFIKNDIIHLLPR